MNTIAVTYVMDFPDLSFLNSDKLICLDSGKLSRSIDYKKQLTGK